MSDWNQPVCGACWAGQHPDRSPVRVSDPTVERCCWCGYPTTAGIWVRLDPTTVPHPAREAAS